MNRSSELEVTQPIRRPRPWRYFGIVLVSVAALAGSGLLGAALSPPTADRPPATAQVAPVGLGTPAGIPPGSGTPSPAGTVPSPVVVPIPPPVEPAPAPGASGTVPHSGAEPVEVRIPRLGVVAPVLPVGLNPDGTLGIPPASRTDHVGWYQAGPAPGEEGNAVVVGHLAPVDFLPAVFRDLPTLIAGDAVQVVRADGTVLTFLIGEVRTYPKSAFPSELVYGPTDRPGLRLVTCGGRFNELTAGYPDHVIAFADLVG